MGYADMIQKRLQTLPLEKQAEVYDFVEFIATRNTTTDAADWNDQEFSQLSIAQAMRGMEDDPVSYTASDITDRWQ